MITRLYKQTSTGKWFHRIDTNSPMSLDDAKQSISDQFSIPTTDVEVVETDTLTTQALDNLRLSVEWDAGPLPVPNLTDSGNLIRPASSPKDRLEVLEDKVDDGSANLPDVLELLALTRRRGRP